MSKAGFGILAGLAVALAAAFITGCGVAPPAPPSSGSLVIFGTDTPACDVESLPVTITSASLLPAQRGQSPVLTNATVNFARLADFTTIIGTANVSSGTYNQLQISLSIPSIVALNTATNPPSSQLIQPTPMVTTLTLPVTPSLVVSAGATSAITIDFNLPKSLQIVGNGQISGTINPQITVASSVNAGSNIGEADALYGIAGGLTAQSLPSGFSESFPLTLNDGTGQQLTLLANSSTVFEGDNAITSGPAAGDFVEVDAIANSSGQLVAQTVDVEEPTSFSGLRVALLGKIVNVTRDSSGNATSFALFVEDEDPNIDTYLEQGGQPLLYGDLAVTLTSGTKYFTNWQQWNKESFTFGPSTLGVGESVAVFGTFGSAPGPTFAANQIFLRPRSVQGNFRTLQAAGSDGVTGGFTMAPCSGLFGSQTMTVLTYPTSVFNGVSGLAALTSSPSLNVVGVLFYQQSSGAATTGAAWNGPTWVMQAKEIHQLPN